MTLLEGFLKYVQVDTTADEKSTTYPSSPGQLVLGAMLRDELLSLGFHTAKQSPHGIVTATIPATVTETVPTIALIAHVDTSPETTGKNVKPQVIRNYDGRDIVLPADPTKVIRVAEHPELLGMKGKTLVTTDGTTLLGADDKAGVAVIMEFARRLAADKTIPHGPIVVCFTCDEEIGKGVLHLEPSDLGATVAYTLDGQGEAEIEAETFSADRATITITGVNIHPAIAKGRMINAVRIAADLIERLPKRTYSPETTEGREGFLHPYTIEGGVAKVVVQCLLRSFETAELEAEAEMIRVAAKQVERDWPGATVTVDVKPQYRNMREGVAKDPRAVAYAVEATKRAGLEPKMLSIRGGTDGSLLTAKGLPTPNLSCGEHAYHSLLEFTCVEEMESGVKTLLELAKVWAGR